VYSEGVWSIADHAEHNCVSIELDVGGGSSAEIHLQTVAECVSLLSYLREFVERFQKSHPIAPTTTVAMTIRKISAASIVKSP
jgi:hypothetical protein